MKSLPSLFKAFMHWPSYSSSENEPWHHQALKLHQARFRYDWTIKLSNYRVKFTYWSVMGRSSRLPLHLFCSYVLGTSGICSTSSGIFLFQATLSERWTCLCFLHRLFWTSLWETFEVTSVNIRYIEVSYHFSRAFLSHLSLTTFALMWLLMCWYWIILKKGVSVKSITKSRLFCKSEKTYCVG